MANHISTDLLLQSVIEQSPDLVAIWDRDLKLRVFNSKFVSKIEQALHTAPVVGMRLSELLNSAPSQAKHVIIELYQRALNGEDIEDRKTLATLFSLPSNYQISLRPLLDSSGQALGVKQTAKDISLELKKTEFTSNTEATLDERSRLLHEIEVQKARFEATIQQLPVAVIIGEAPSGKLVFSNNKMREVWGFESHIPSNDINEYQQWTGFHPNGHRYQPKEWPLARSILNGEVVVNEDVRILRGDGRFGLVRLNSTPVRDSEGKIIAGVIISEDITHQKEMEDQLRQSQKLLRDVLDAAETIAFLKDLDGKYIFINQKYSRTYHLEREKVIGKSDREIFGDTIGSQLIRNDRKIIELGTPFEFEETLLTPQGQSKTYLSVKFPLKDESGRIYAVGGFAADITERKQTEDRLRESEKRFQTVTDNAASCLFVMDKNGHPTFMNPAAQRVTGYSSLEEIAHRPLHYAIHWKKPDGSHYPMEECPIDNAQAELQPVQNQGEIFCRKDGTLFPVAYSVSPLEKDGLVIGSVLEFRDITVEKQAQEALRKSQELAQHQRERLDLATSSSEVGIWEWDSETDLVTGSEIQQKIFEFPEGKDCIPLQMLLMKVHPEDLETTQKGFRHAIDHQTTFVSEFRILKNDGGLAWIYGRGNPTLDEQGKLSRFVGVNIDITERKNAENALKFAIQARDEFLSVASHELKTPICSLKLQVQLARRLRDRGDTAIYNPSRINKLIDHTDRQVDRLIRLIDDMLDIARIRSGKLTIQKEHISFRSLVCEVVERLAPNLMEAGTPVSCNCPKEPLFGNWDRVRMEQVITNLLTNAMKYGEGRPVRIQLERSIQAPDRVRLTIRDQGKGIAPEAKERIFNRFERAISPNEVSGLGLGLFITRQIIEAHQGTICVESDGPGKGAQFIIELPTLDPRFSMDDSEFDYQETSARYDKLPQVRTHR